MSFKKNFAMAVRSALSSLLCIVILGTPDLLLAARTDQVFRLNGDRFLSLTDWGRVRVSLNIKLRQELIAECFWDPSFNETCDARPPEGAAAKMVTGSVSPWKSTTLTAASSM